MTSLLVMAIQSLYSLIDIYPQQVIQICRLGIVPALKQALNECMEPFLIEWCIKLCDKMS